MEQQQQQQQLPPFRLYEPMNLLAYISFFSPLLLALTLTSLSFLFENWKGCIYLAWLLSALVIRHITYLYGGNGEDRQDTTGPAICNAVQYSRYGNTYVSGFVFGFTGLYLCIPLFTNQGENYLFFTSLLAYGMLDVGIKRMYGCMFSCGEWLANVTAGSVLASLAIYIMVSSGNASSLFFNGVASNKDVCHMAKHQQFKCRVYKNGELIGNM